MLKELQTNDRLWKLFTKQEEYDNPNMDEYGRYSYSSTLHKNVLNPEVSKFLIENGLKVEYPKSKTFAVCLTHDIDLVYFPELKRINGIVQKSKILQASESLFGIPEKIYGKINRLWNFSKIMNLEKKYDAKSSFYFLALEKNEQDYRYDVDELEELLREIINKGWEVGLHGGPNAFNDLQVIKKEKKKIENLIGKKIIGYRNHYMKFEIPTTWELLKKAGFKYDTTYGYHDHVGFRNGICHPFKPWNLKTGKSIEIIELPLIIMDSTLLNYMKLDIKSSWEIVKQLIDTVKNYKGTITILWHNNNFVGEMLGLYEKILEYCHRKNGWLTSGQELCQWWEENAFSDTI